MDSDCALRIRTDLGRSFWVLLIWAGVQWVLIFIFVPETYAPVLLRRKAVKLRQETGDDRVRDSNTCISLHAYRIRGN